MQDSIRRSINIKCTGTIFHNKARRVKSIYTKSKSLLDNMRYGSPIRKAFNSSRIVNVDWDCSISNSALIFNCLSIKDRSLKETPKGISKRVGGYIDF